MAAAKKAAQAVKSFAWATLNNPEVGSSRFASVADAEKDIKEWFEDGNIEPGEVVEIFQTVKKVKIATTIEEVK